MQKLTTTEAFRQKNSSVFNSIIEKDEVVKVCRYKESVYMISDARFQEYLEYLEEIKDPEYRTLKKEYDNLNI